MEGKSNFFILIAVIAFLSFTLAMLMGYIFFVGNKGDKPVDLGENEKIIVVPKDEELDFENLFEGRTFFNLNRSSEGQNHVIQVTLKMEYFKKVDGIRNPLEKIQLNKSRLRELVGSYFMSLTIDDVNTPQGRDTIRKELIVKMNELLLANEETNNSIIYNIVFEEWLYQ